MQIDLSSDLLEHDELDLLLWIRDIPFHTVVITKSEWLDCDNCNLYLTETKAIVGILPLITDGCHSRCSQSYYYVCTITGVSLEAGLLATRGNYWVQPNILQLFTITPHLKHGCCSFFHAGDVILDLTSIWLKSQVYIAWKFRIVGRSGRIMLSFSRLRELSSLLALVLHLAIGISHFIWGESKADSFQMEDMLACDTNVSLLLLGMKCLRGISWSQ